MQIQPYLFFDGRCEEALEFYRRALGAEVTMLMRNRESPDPPPPGALPAGSGEQGDACELSHRRFGRDGFRRPLPGQAFLHRLLADDHGC